MLHNVSIKAIHEVTFSDISSEAFIAELHRYSADVLLVVTPKTIIEQIELMQISLPDTAK